MTIQAFWKSRRVLAQLPGAALAAAATLVLALLVSAPASGQDLNKDGKIDAVFTHKQSFNQVCFGDGTGAFTKCTDVKGNGQFTISDQINTTKGKLVDWNGDGALDIVFAMEGHASVVCINDGHGNFNDQVAGVGCYELFGYGTFPYNSEDVAVGDLDGDGAPDLVFANGGNAGAPLAQPNVVCLGSNTGSSVCDTFPGVAQASTGVALGDVNGDGKLDVVFSNRGARNTVCLNLGKGANGMVFDCRDIAPSAGVADTKVSNAVAVGDLPPGYGTTPDGLLDVVFANDGPNEYCFNTGDWSGSNVGLTCGKFNNVTSWTQSTATAHTLGVVVADFLPSAHMTNGTTIHQGSEIIFANVDAPNVLCYDTFARSSLGHPN